MIQINFYIGSRYPVKRQVLRNTVIRVLKEHRIDHAQVDVLIVGKRKITSLNESKLQHSGATDVLSFPQHERHQLHDFPLPLDVPPHLGDIVISFPESVRMAKRFGKLVDQQISFYLEHGLLHLLGYHHE
ncbi:MAG TPA: rRNA maturation RNase YbeY [Candidatus Pacebacteria bacterium]|nr:rRNA maturation RNase YbeY [Candidatus Paceibacterota bacterium]